MNLQLGSNDAILLVSLLYSCVDLTLEWDQFSSCKKPIHRWLLVSYACVIAFRLTHLMGTKTATSAAPTMSAAADFLLDLRQKGTLPRVLAAFTWLVALPFFVLWTVLGTFWLYTVVQESPQCVPSSTHLWFSGFWLALCYVWIFVHCALGIVAGLLERRVRRAENDLREMTDSDTTSRWGQVSEISNYTALQNQKEGIGLTPTEIKQLPGVSVLTERDFECTHSDDMECPICCDTFNPGDNVRTLPGCDHKFHRSCIDLWLLRRADCPLCKRSAKCQGSA